MPQGLFVPRGRADRHVIVIDSEDTATSRLADTFIKIPRDADFEVIWALRQLLRGIELPASFDVRRSARTSCSGWRHKWRVAAMAPCFLDWAWRSDASDTRMSKPCCDWWRTSTTSRDSPLAGCAFRATWPGADAVLCWLTGFPFAVNLARGYPRYNPGEYSANELLERGEVDACLLVGSESCRDLSPRAQRALEQLPTIALDYPNVTPPFAATVQITTAIYGIHAAGTAYRMDEVPIPLRQLVPSSLPTDDEVLLALADRLR